MSQNRRCRQRCARVFDQVHSRKAPLDRVARWTEASFRQGLETGHLRECNFQFRKLSYSSCSLRSRIHLLSSRFKSLEVDWGDQVRTGETCLDDFGRRRWRDEDERTDLLRALPNQAATARQPGPPARSRNHFRSEFFGVKKTGTVSKWQHSGQYLSVVEVGRNSSQRAERQGDSTNHDFRHQPALGIPPKSGAMANWIYQGKPTHI